MLRWGPPPTSSWPTTARACARRSGSAPRSCTSPQCCSSTSRSSRSILCPHRALQDVLSHFRASGGTIVFSSHVMTTVERLCDQVAIVHRGEVVRSGPTEEVRRSHARGALHRRSRWERGPPGPGSTGCAGLAAVIGRGERARLRHGGLLRLRLVEVAAPASRLPREPTGPSRAAAVPRHEHHRRLRGRSLVRATRPTAPSPGRASLVPGFTVVFSHGCSARSCSAASTTPPIRAALPCPLHPRASSPAASRSGGHRFPPIGTALQRSAVVVVGCPPSGRPHLVVARASSRSLLFSPRADCRSSRLAITPRRRDKAATRCRRQRALPRSCGSRRRASRPSAMRRSTASTACCSGSSGHARRAGRRRRTGATAPHRCASPACFRHHRFGTYAAWTSAHDVAARQGDRRSRHSHRPTRVARHALPLARIAPRLGGRLCRRRVREGSAYLLRAVTSLGPSCRR